MWHAECERIFLIAIKPDVAASAVFKRDHGVCANCKLDTDTLRKQFYKAWARTDVTTKEPSKLIKQYPWMRLWKRRFWEVDHIKPLWMSNGDIAYFHLDNLQTLCEPCHEAKSKLDTAAWRNAQNPNNAKTS